MESTKPEDSPAREDISVCEQFYSPDEVAQDFFLSESEISAENIVEGEQGHPENRGAISGESCEAGTEKVGANDSVLSKFPEKLRVANEEKDGDEQADDFAGKGVMFSKEKAAVLKKFMRERGVVVSKVIRLLSGRKEDFERATSNILEEEVNKDAKANTDTVDKKEWFSFLKPTTESGKISVTNTQTSLTLAGAVTLYTRSGCPDCRAARSILRRKGLTYQEINVDVFPQRRTALKERIGTASVPRLFFNEKLIGGIDELVELDNTGELDDKIKEVVENKAPATSPLPPVYGEEDPQDKALDEFAGTMVKLREKIQVKDRFAKYHLFSRCFLGSDVVDFLVEEQKLSRTEAVEYGRKLAAKHFFHHVLQEHLFEDGNNFYRFLEHDPVVSTKCYNFFGTTNDFEPYQAHEVGKELTKLILAIHETHVSEDGKHVNYEAISRSEEFRRYVKMTMDLQRTDLQILTREEKLALFINLFNFMVIHAMILLGHPNGPLERMTLFWDFRYVIGGYPYSLSAIQNGILRANQRPPYTFTRPFGLKDPRFEICLAEPEPLIHFAISYGTKSSPVLRCYTPEAIDAELRFAARAFFEEGGMSVTPETKTIFLSKILKWYSIDFGNSVHEVLHWATNHLDPEKAEELQSLLDSKDAIKISYQLYNWSTNN